MNGDQDRTPVSARPAAGQSHDLLGAMQESGNSGGSESLLTALVAVGANVLVAVAKTAAAAVTGWAARRPRWRAQC
jgi:hypothetical protein